MFSHLAEHKNDSVSPNQSCSYRLFSSMINHLTNMNQKQSQKPKEFEIFSWDVLFNIWQIVQNPKIVLIKAANSHI